MTKPRPRGREEVASAILESAGKLIAERGPSGVALRDIADDAGVNFGLLYHYFGTKEELLSEVYARAAENAAGLLREADHLDDALSMLMTFGDGTTARLVAWAVLEGKDPADLGASPALSVLAELLRRDAREAGNEVSAKEAQVFVAMATVIALGWRLFGPMALTFAGVDGQKPERYTAQVQAYMRRFARVAAESGSSPKPKPRKAPVKATPARRPRTR